MAGYIGSKVAVVSSGAERKKVFTATSGQTSFTGLSYTVNNVHVFQNGVRLVDGTDYTATNGNSITLTVGAATDDQVVVVSYNTFQTSDTVSASAGGTFSNAVTIDADGSTVLTVDRATSDGTIIDVQKSGSSVGGIGTKNGALHIGSTTGSDSYLGFYSNSIIPTTSDGSDKDAVTDLGYSGSRFKDLYLSGGVYLGGTGSANHLDDYEEGTWTPSFVNVSAPTYTTQDGRYTKVGNTVYFEVKVAYSSLDTSDPSALSISLPFAGTNVDYGGLIRLVPNSANTGFAGGVTEAVGATIANGNAHFSAVGSSDNSTYDYNSGKFNASGALYFAGKYRTA